MLPFDPSTYPGTPRHQRALRAITERYAADSRTRAILLFGSLARGNWDADSDLDLDVVLEDGVALDMAAELRRLCEALEVAGERAAVILPKRADEGDVVCVSLLELSVRFHPLATTSPNIVESMRLLWGRIALEEIAAAGLANHAAMSELPDILLGRVLRSALEVDVALQRHRLWFAVEALAAARDALIELYAAAHGGLRPLHFFEENADATLHATLGAMLPTYSAASVRMALGRLMDLLEGGIVRIADGRAALSNEQRALLRGVRERQALLDEE